MTGGDERRGEERRTDGVREGKGKQAWREGKEERGAETDGPGGGGGGGGRRGGWGCGGV